MMEVVFEGVVRIPGDRTFRVQRLLSRIAETARKQSAILRMKQRRAFANQGHSHHGGRQWAQLSPKTIRRKGHSIILVETGKMRRSQSTPAAKVRLVGKNIIFRFTTHNNTEYADYHMTGTSRMVARPPNVITGQDKQEIRDAFESIIPPPSGGAKKRKRR